MSGPFIEFYFLIIKLLFFPCSSLIPRALVLVIPCCCFENWIVIIFVFFINHYYSKEWSKRPKDKQSRLSFKSPKRRQLITIATFTNSSSQVSLSPSKSESISKSMLISKLLTILKAKITVISTHQFLPVCKRTPSISFSKYTDQTFIHCSHKAAKWLLGSKALILEIRSMSRAHWESSIISQAESSLQTISHQLLRKSFSSQEAAASLHATKSSSKSSTWKTKPST